MKKRHASKLSRKKSAKIIHLKTVASTNDCAKVLAIEGAPHGTVVRADVQTRGRGRNGSDWISPPGGLWMSIILRPEGKILRLNFVPALASLVVLKVLRGLGVEGGIKWPNDVSVKGRKIAGILCESSVLANGVQWVIVGIGVNVNNSPPKIASSDSKYETESVISLTGVKTNLSFLAQTIRDSILQHYDQLWRGGETPLLFEYNAHNILRGHSVRISLFEDVLDGIANGVDAYGRLKVKGNDGFTHRVRSEDALQVETLSV